MMILRPPRPTVTYTLVPYTTLFRSGGDETRLTGAAARNCKSWLYLAASHSTPLGAGGTRAELSGAALRTRPRGLAVDGEAWSAGLAVTHPLIRATRRNLIASARIDYLDSKNALFGSTIAAEKTWTASGSLAFRLSEDRTVLRSEEHTSELQSLMRTS